MHGIFEEYSIQALVAVACNETEYSNPEYSWNMLVYLQWLYIHYILKYVHKKCFIVEILTQSAAMCQTLCAVFARVEMQFCKQSLMFTSSPTWCQSSRSQGDRPAV